MVRRLAVYEGQSKYFFYITHYDHQNKPRRNSSGVYKSGIFLFFSRIFTCQVKINTKKIEKQLRRLKYLANQIIIFLFDKHEKDILFKIHQGVSYNGNKRAIALSVCYTQKIKLTRHFSNKYRRDIFKFAHTVDRHKILFQKIIQ